MNSVSIYFFICG